MNEVQCSLSTISYTKRHLSTLAIVAIIQLVLNVLISIDRAVFRADTIPVTVAFGRIYDTYYVASKPVLL